MNKIMNNVCTIICNDFLNALEINFSKTGSLQEYNESMQLAMDLSIIHQINHWIVEKHDFNDLKLDNFLMLIFSWSKIVSKRNKADQKVTIITNKIISDRIGTILKKEWWQRHYSRSDIKIQPFSYRNKEEFVENEVNV